MTRSAISRRTRYVVEIDGRFREVPPKPPRVCDVARERGLSLDAVRYRIRAGWDVHRALTEPVRPAPERKGRPW